MKPIRHRPALVIVMALLVSACGPDDVPVQGSDFAVLAQQVDGYAQARPGTPLVFPDDHGPHPEYRIEWWYLTANLNDTEGNPYGAQWTLFRVATRPPAKNQSLREARPTAIPGTHPTDGSQSQQAGQSNQVFMAHMAITTADDHVSFQRYARGGQQVDLSRAGVTAKPFSAWLDDWILQSTGNNWLPMEVKARQGDYALNLQLHSTTPVVLQGEAGFSQKNIGGGGSFYYSQPFLQASGSLLVDGQELAVSGEAWLDREWSSQFLQDNQAGWDWFSLHLENGEKLMLFQLRQRAGEPPGENFLHGSLIAPDGSTTALDPQRIKLIVSRETSIAGRNLPLHWRIELPQINRQLEIEALHPEQWLEVDFPYWEGVVIVTGNGPENRGRGYMELTGYATPESNHP